MICPLKYAVNSDKFTGSDLDKDTAQLCECGDLGEMYCPFATFGRCRLIDAVDAIIEVKHSGEIN